MRHWKQTCKHQCHGGKQSIWGFLVHAISRGHLWTQIPPIVVLATAWLACFIHVRCTITQSSFPNQSRCLASPGVSPCFLQIFKLYRHGDSCPGIHWLWRQNHKTRLLHRLDRLTAVTHWFYDVTSITTAHCTIKYNNHDSPTNQLSELLLNGYINWSCSDTVIKSNISVVLTG